MAFLVGQPPILIASNQQVVFLSPNRPVRAAQNPSGLPEACPRRGLPEAFSRAPGLRETEEAVEARLCIAEVGPPEPGKTKANGQRTEGVPQAVDFVWVGFGKLPSGWRCSRLWVSCWFPNQLQQGTLRPMLLMEAKLSEEVVCAFNGFKDAS